MLKRIQIILLFTCFICLAPEAQEKWSLEDCINYAIENNLSHRAFIIEEQNQLLNARQAKLNLLPSVYASSSAGYYFGRSVDASTNTYTNTQYYSTSGYLYASLTLFNGFQKQNNISYYKYQLHAAQWDKINNSDDLAFEIVNAYYNVLYYKELVQISYDDLTLTEIELDKVKTQIEIGLKAKSDIAQMQAQLEQEKLNILLAENQYEEAKQNLLHSMNYAGLAENKFELQNLNPQPLLNQHICADSIFEIFSQYSPLIQSAESALKAAQKYVAYEKGSYLPSISATSYIGSAFYQTDTDQNGKTTAFNDQINNNQSKYIGASITIPIFHKNTCRTAVKQAKLDRDLAQNNLEINKQNLYFDIEKNVRDLKSRYQKYIQSQTNKEANEYSFIIAQKKYKEGLLNIIDLLQVKKQVSKAKSQLLLAKIEWEIKNKTIQFYMGSRFWE